MKKSNLLLFFIGLLCWTRVHLVGMIGISELLVLLMGPFLFVKDYAILRKDGFLTLCWLFLLTCIGCVIGCIYNHTSVSQGIRGFATPFMMFAAIATLHHLLRRNLNGLKWFILGWSLSGLVTFVIKGGDASVLMSDDGQMGSNTSAVMRMYLFAPVLLLPIRFWYRKLPAWVSAGLVFSFAIYFVAASASGRSTALSIIAGGILILIGQRSVRRMASIKKHFLLFIMLALVSIVVAKFLYSQAASAGWLGDAARAKYELQSRKNGNSILGLLMAGRIECFAGAFAAVEQPIVGYGPWAFDTTHVYERFLEKYGNADDYDKYMESLTNPYADHALPQFIPCHSHLIGFWVWYGVFGLVLWLYVIWLIYKYFRVYVDAVPQWYGIIVTLIPPLAWDIFFSPLCQRLQTAALLCALLFVRAIAKGKVPLTNDMMREYQYYRR